jgi:hypothetical protein
MEDQVFNELIRADSRCSAFHIDPQGLSERLEEIKLSNNLPKEVSNQIQVCKKLCLYTYFVYEFATIAQGLSFLAIETALKERLRLFYPDGIEFKMKVDGTVKKEKPLSLSHFQALLTNKDLRIQKIDGFFEKGVLLGDLIEWSISKGILNERFNGEGDVVKDLRNTVAHPIGQTIVSPWSAIHGLSLNVQLINSLFK